MRTYTVPSGRSLDELKQEIETERAKWIEAADEVLRLLKEADDSGVLIQGGWASAFSTKAATAEDDMLEMTEPHVATIADLKRLATKVQSDLSVAVIEVRTSLREEMDSYDRWFKRK